MHRKELQGTRGTRRPRRLLTMAALVLSLTSAAGCTVTQNAHYQVDYVYWGYHFHIYQRPTTQVWFIHVAACANDANCTFSFVRGQVEVNGIFGWLTGVDRFFDDDVADFAEALAAATPPNPSVNEPHRFGCLSGYRNTAWYFNDGDWYASGYHPSFCFLGTAVS
jgi:hypothetical protein